MKDKRHTGSKGEQLAVEFFTAGEYTIIERNWRYRRCEVDIIAAKNNCLHFIEVKTRTSALFGWPEESVGTKKMNNLLLAAEGYQHLHPQWQRIQFDVLSITLFAQQPAAFLLLEDVYF